MPPTPALRILVVAAALAAAPGAWSQAPRIPEAEAAGRARGQSDGARDGHDRGEDEGLAGVLGHELYRGFRRGVTGYVEEWRVREAAEAGRAAGALAARTDGQAAGRVAGAEEAAAAYLRLEGRPSYAATGPPSPWPGPPPRPPPTRDCQPPPRTWFEPLRGHRFEADPATLDTFAPRWAEYPDEPYPDVPPKSRRRNWARDQGFALDAERDAWSDAYGDAYRRGFEDAWDGEIEGVPRWRLDDAFDEGHAAGLREAERRARCHAHDEAFATAHAGAFADAWASAHEAAWRETAGRHERSAVLVLEAASLRDASGDGVIEPGEDVRLVASVVNAGFVASGPDPAWWRAVRELRGQGVVPEAVPARTRRAIDIALGTVDAGAPLDAGLVVEVALAGGELRRVESEVGRPVMLGDVAADLAARDGEVVVVVHAEVQSLARQRTDRGLRVQVGDASAAVGPLDVVEGRLVDVVVPVDAQRTATDGGGGSVELRDAAGAAWMKSSWRWEPDVARAVRLVPELRDAQPIVRGIAARLEAEHERALADPRLHAREGDSELERYAAARGGLPNEARELLRREVEQPLLERAAARDVPRRVRRAIQKALEPGR